MRAIVVGAGPGGATAALELARAGATVTLVEKCTWPRDKTCGDAISPLGIQEGRKLGLEFEGDVRLHRAFVTTPGNIVFRGGWPRETPWGTTIERRRFDAAIVSAAIASGATFTAGTLVRELEVQARGVRATLDAADGSRCLTADVAIVAEGATGRLASRLGFAPYRSKLVALRGYADAPRALIPEYGLFFDRPLSPGYGWIFPMSERRVNIGILVDPRSLQRAGGDLRAMLNRWLTSSTRVRDLLGERPALHALKGGIIPTGRRRRTLPRVFLVGDAAGVADPFTAEGIYEAISSGHLAANAIAQSASLDAARERYERDLLVFDANERAARFLRATFDIAIDPYARRAAGRSGFADQLNTGVFFMKKSPLHFVVGLAKAW